MLQAIEAREKICIPQGCVQPHQASTRGLETADYPDFSAVEDRLPVIGRVIQRQRERSNCISKRVVGDKTHEEELQPADCIRLCVRAMLHSKQITP